jgi:mevalonate kinase
MRNYYPGKILLYGEYSIVLKNKALAIPLFSQSGSWERANGADNKTLYGWLEYLKKLPNAANYNLVLFEEELNRGLFFESTIPQGYGAGSSGALVAAFYAHSSISPITNPSITNLQELKKEFGVLESYFHGNSSGTDPLVSYLKHSLLLANDKIDKINLPSPPDDLFFFLLDCGMARKTEPLVSTFLHEIHNNKDYTADFENHYVPVVNQTIQEHLDSRFSALKKCWLELSQLQTHFFKAMIPKNLIEYWHKGNNEGHTHLKLCGAGGGGYLLGLSTLKEKQVSLLYPNFKITALPFS